MVMVRISKLLGSNYSPTPKLKLTISIGEIRIEKETGGTIWTKERDSGLEIEVEQGTEGEGRCRQITDGKEITQKYKKKNIQEEPG